MQCSVCSQLNNKPRVVVTDIYCFTKWLLLEAYGIRQKECNERAVAALISTAYRVPRLSLCVCHTLTLFQKSWRLSGENAVCFAELQRVGKNHGAFSKKVPQYASRTNSEANHKSATRFLSKSGAQMFN